MWTSTLLAIFILIVISLLKVFVDQEKNKYRKISFKDKKQYLCVYYLYGNKDLKSNIGVLSKNEDTYILETEDKMSVHTFTFLENEIVKIEVEEKSGIRMDSQVVCNIFNCSKDFEVHDFEVEEGRKMRIKKIYSFKIALVNGMILALESNRNPDTFFKG